MAIRFAKGPAIDGSIGFNKPVTTAPPNPFIRQIGEHKWLYGLTLLQNNTDINEITVASEYSGWKYILTRGDTNKTFIQQTFYANNLMSSTIMIIN